MIGRRSRQLVLLAIVLLVFAFMSMADDFRQLVDVIVVDAPPPASPPPPPATSSPRRSTTTRKEATS